MDKRTFSFGFYILFKFTKCNIIEYTNEKQTLNNINNNKNSIVDYNYLY